MRQLVTLLVILLLVNCTTAKAQSFYKTSQENTVLNRAMAPGDPNLDPNWDWTLDITYDLYGIVNQGIASYPGQKLPYFTLSGSTAELNVGESTDNYRDFRKSDGWVLLHRDFGTPSSAPNVIHYVLYNKYRGVMRVFYFNNILSGSFYAFVKLSFLSSNPKTGVLGNDDDNPFLDSYNPNVIVTAVSSNVQNNPAWCYADFDVSMYDDMISGKTDATLSISIEGIQESAMKLAGTQTLQGVMESGSISASTRPSTGIMDYYNLGTKSYHKGKKWYKNGLKGLDKLTTLATKNTWYGNIASGIVFATYPTGIAKLVPYASAAAGFVKNFLGGFKNQAAAVPMSYRVDLEGELELSGEITVSSIGASFGFRLPGVAHTDPSGNSNLPLYDELLGVFSLRTKPTIEVADNSGQVGGCTWEPYPIEDYNCYFVIDRKVALREPVSCAYNGNAISIISIETALVDGNGPTVYRPNSIFSNFLVYSAYYEGGMTNTEFNNLRDQYIAESNWNSVAVKVKYVGIGNVSDTLTYLKVYPANVVNVAEINKPEFTAPIAAISGPSTVGANQNNTWTANVTSGIAPYTYKWYKDGSQIGTAQSMTTMGTYNFVIKLEVTDAYGQVSSVTKNITVLPTQTVTITGPSWVKKGTSATWTANVSGGVAPFTYKWYQNTSQIGTAQSVTRTVSGNFTLKVEVTGANGVKVTQTKNITSGLLEPKMIAENAIPEEFILGSNYPNPFNPSTTLQYGLKENTHVVLTIYNMLGQEVRTLVNEVQTAGYKAVQWDGKNNAGTQVPSGIYIYKLQAGSFVSSKKMLLVK